MRLRQTGNEATRFITHVFALLAAMGVLADAAVADASTGAPPVGEAYSWQLPAGFPQPLVPADNPMSNAKVLLGQQLFHDRRLSVTGQYACANCHDPERAYTDGRARALGATGLTLAHNAPSVVNVAYAAALTWADASVHTLESQMRRPLFNESPVELGLRGHEAALIAALEANANDARAFAAAFPGEARPVNIDNLIKAVAAFERSLIFATSPFDRYVFEDDQQALSASAKRGMALFFSRRSACSNCHYGLNFSGEIVYEGHGHRHATCANTGLAPGKIRVPSLRNCAITAPYMHDGRLPSLEAVIEYYNLGGRRPLHDAMPPHIDPRVRPLGLGAQERRDLLAFLQSLTDPIFSGNKLN